MNYNLRYNYKHWSPSQIIVIQIHYLSFLKAELRLAGRYVQIGNIQSKNKKLRVIEFLTKQPKKKN